MICKVLLERNIEMNTYSVNIENRLRQLSIENTEYAELWSTWNLNKQTLDPILNTIIKDYPYFSLHDHTHSESVLLNIERVLGSDNINKLSPTDLWLLLHVSYLHDFGMVILDKKIYDIWKSSEFQKFIKEQSEGTDKEIRASAKLIMDLDKDSDAYDSTWPLNVKKAVTILLSSYCRNKHADFSREYILDEENEWNVDLGHNGLIKNRLISLIGDISVIHTKPFEDVLSLYKESNGFKNDCVHPRLVACMLRLGDVLDLDNGRFNPYCNKIFGPLPQNSKNHFEKHESLKHVLVTKECIELEADCKTDEVYRETRKWFDLLKNEIDNLNLLWNDIAPPEFGRPPKLGICKITRNGSEDFNELSDLKFNISQKRAFEIIEGSSIYKDKFSCLREIVQNAEDASKIQLWRDIQSGMYYGAGGVNEEKVKAGTLLPDEIKPWVYKIYSINIDISRNEQNNAVVTIQDHGTGISISSLKAICNVGQSYHSQREAKNEIDGMPEWLKPTANFGIGLQSCFMVTDKFNIITKHANETGIEIIFESGKDSGYVSVKGNPEYQLRGSVVKIEFKNGSNFRYDMFGFTAQSLKEIEPFATNCIVMYKIIESIFKECASGFFDVNVCSNELSFRKTIPSMFGKDTTGQGNYKRNDEIAYKLSDKDNSFEAWYNNNFYKISFIEFGKNSIKISFKGKTIENYKYISPMEYLGLNIYVDIYGISAKEALSLNRENLTYAASNKICEDLEKVIEIYMRILFEGEKIMNAKTKFIDSYFLFSLLRNKDFSIDLKEKVSTNKNIHAIKYDNELKKYKVDFISLVDIADSYPNLSYCPCENNDGFFIKHGLSKKDLENALNSDGSHKGEFKYIIVDENLIRYLRPLRCDYTYIESEKEICIKTVNTNNKLHSPDPYTRKRLIKHLVFDPQDKSQSNFRFTRRTAIHAISPYESLATKLDNNIYIGCDFDAEWYIISPIAYEDAVIVDNMSKDAFINYIIENNFFDNIVSYVTQNNKNKNIPKEDIIKDYKKLLSEYYDNQKS